MLVRSVGYAEMTTVSDPFCLSHGSLSEEQAVLWRAKPLRKVELNPKRSVSNVAVEKSVCF